VTAAPLPQEPMESGNDGSKRPMYPKGWPKGHAGLTATTDTRYCYG